MGFDTDLRLFSMIPGLASMTSPQSDGGEMITVNEARNYVNSLVEKLGRDGYSEQDMALLKELPQFMRAHNLFESLLKKLPQFMRVLNLFEFENRFYSLCDFERGLFASSFKGFTCSHSLSALDLFSKAKALAISRTDNGRLSDQDLKSLRIDYVKPSSRSRTWHEVVMRGENLVIKARHSRYYDTNIEVYKNGRLVRLDESSMEALGERIGQLIPEKIVNGSEFGEQISRSALNFLGVVLREGLSASSVKDGLALAVFSKKEGAIHAWVDDLRIKTRPQQALLLHYVVGSPESK
jgi:hypothetical protein